MARARKYDIIGDDTSDCRPSCINVKVNTSETIFLDRGSLDFFLTIGSMMTSHFRNNIIINKTTKELWFSVNQWIDVPSCEPNSFGCMSIEDKIKNEKCRWDECGITFDIDFIYYEGTEAHFIRLTNCSTIKDYKPRVLDNGVRIKFTYDEFIDELSPEDVGKNMNRIRVLYNSDYIPFFPRVTYGGIMNLLSKEYGKRPVRVFVSQVSIAEPFKLNKAPASFKSDISLLVKYYFDTMEFDMSNLDFDPCSVEVLDNSDVEYTSKYLVQSEIEMQRLSSFIKDMSLADIVIFQTECFTDVDPRIAYEVFIQKRICDLYGITYLSFNDIMYLRGISEDVDNAIDRVFGKLTHDIMNTNKEEK